MNPEPEPCPLLNILRNVGDGLCFALELTSKYLRIPLSLQASLLAETSDDARFKFVIKDL
jgi:hypothetical protein